MFKVGGLKQLLISKELLQSAQNAWHQYHAHLKSQTIERSRKERCQTKTCGRKHLLIKSDINLLLADVDKASDKTEELKSFPHITKANALCRWAKDKEDELKVVRKELSDTKHLLTDMWHTCVWLGVCAWPFVL